MPLTQSAGPRNLVTPLANNRRFKITSVCGALAGCGDYCLYQGACLEPDFFSVDPSHGLNASAEAVQLTFITLDRAKRS